MSDHELHHEMHTGSDPSDLRHDVTSLDKRAAERVLQAGDHIGNDTQEPAAPRNPWHNDPENFVPVASFEQAARPTLQRPELPVRATQALQWHNGRGDTITDLAQFDWEYASNMPNVELRTIHAHLMEGIAKARQEMRVRGMVVDF